MKTSSILMMSILSAAALGCPVYAAPPQTPAATSPAAPGAVSPTSPSRRGEGVNVVSPDDDDTQTQVDAGSPGVFAKGNNNAQTPVGNNNAQTPNGSNKAQTPVGNNNAQTPQGNNRASTPDGSSPGMTPIDH